MNALLEAWDIHNRTLLFVLDELSPEQLAVKLAKGKAVWAQFSHIHAVRGMWLKSAAPDLYDGFEKAPEPATKEQLADLLKDSHLRMRTLLERAFVEGRVKGFKPTPEAFLCYLISHESNHRGQADYSLRLAGLPWSDKASFGIWEWGVR